VAGDALGLCVVMDLQVSREDAAEELFRDVERAYRAEDVDAYLSFIDTYTVWVGRGRHLLLTCF
jgi:hypothetical protein